MIIAPLLIYISSKLNAVTKGLLTFTPEDSLQVQKYSKYNKIDWLSELSVWFAFSQIYFYWSFVIKKQLKIP